MNAPDARTPDAILIELANRQDGLSVDEPRIDRAIRMILEDAQVSEAQIGVAILDDSTIHELNRHYLNHDEPTDVLSFMLENTPGRLEGEVAVSADTARRQADHFGWPADDELLLYVIHGTLHLVGYDDHTPEEQTNMRAAEREYLDRLGLNPPIAMGDAKTEKRRGKRVP